MKRYFSKQDIYERSLEARTWQDRWSYVGCLFFSFFEEGKFAILSFPQGSSSVYVKDGDYFIYIGEYGEEGVVIQYFDEMWGSGRYVGEVSMPTVIAISETSKGVVGTEWVKKKKNNGKLGEEGFIPYREWLEWEGKKKKYGLGLKGYKKFSVYGPRWEEVFERWEERKEGLKEEIYFREGLKYIKKYPPRVKLSPSKWREYVVLLGEHFFFLDRMKQAREEAELNKLVWGGFQTEEADEWSGFLFTDFSASIAGPISISGFFRFLMGDMNGVIQRNPSKYSVPTPCL